MQVRKEGEAEAHKAMTHAQVSFIYFSIFFCLFSQKHKSAPATQVSTSGLTCHSQCRIEKAEERDIVYDLVHERWGSRPPMESKTAKRARWPDVATRFSLQPTFRGRRDSDFSCCSRTPGLLLQLRAKQCGPAGPISMKMFLDEVLRSGCTQHNVSIRIGSSLGMQTPPPGS